MALVIAMVAMIVIRTLLFATLVGKKCALVDAIASLGIWIIRYDGICVARDAIEQRESWRIVVFDSGSDRRAFESS